jgi:hypothetical protein
MHLTPRDQPAPGSVTPLGLGDFSAGGTGLLAAAGAFLQPLDVLGRLGLRQLSWGPPAA